MKGLPIWITLILLQHYKSADCAETSRQHDNDKITYVQIKPILDTNVVPSKHPELFRSSRIENIPLQIRGSPINLHTTKKPSEHKLPIAEIIRTPRSEDRVIKQYEQSTEVFAGFTDYIDQGNESEVRFDTSEAVSPSSEDNFESNEKSAEDLVGNENNKISTSRDNDLYKYYPKVKSDKIKIKNFSGKKYYGSNLETLNPTYRKYLETRRFRSRCRCERIWNCPKIQISIPRCPEEYFFCCF